jgi:hypothetical protein
LPAFGLINRSKSETQGQLSRRGGAIRARLGLLFLGSRDRYTQPVLRIHDILVWIRIRGSMPLTIGSGLDSDPDADPSIFVIDLQEAHKKLI